MASKRSLGRRLALSCGGLVVLLVVVGFAGCGIVHVITARRAQEAEQRLQALGAPTTWEEIIPAPVPADQNAAPLYGMALDSLALPDASADAFVAFLSADTPEKRGFLKADVRRILADNAQALDYARQAAQRPACGFDRDWSDPAHIELPRLAELKDLARLASVQAVLLADERRLGSAFEAWSLSLSIVNHLEQEPVISSQMTRYAVLAIAAESLELILRHADLEPDRCRELDSALAKVEIQQPFIPAVSTMPAQLFSMLTSATDAEEPASADSAPEPSSHSLQGERGGTFARVHEAAALEHWAQLVALAGKPYRETAGRFEKLSDDVPWYAFGVKLAARMADLLCAQSVQVRDRAVATVGLMRTGLGLAAYRTAFGKYPESLDALRKALKWEVPQDPFSGKDFHYRREGKGYLLYSIGPDLQDDGGRPMREATGDLVWRMER